VPLYEGVEEAGAAFLRFLWAKEGPAFEGHEFVFVGDSTLPKNKMMSVVLK
jgi:hypothetical protein